MPSESKSAAAKHDGAHLRQLVETLRDCAIFELDPKGIVTSWNAGAERLTGYGAEEIIGHDVATLYSNDEVGRARCAHELAVAEHDGRVENEGWRYRKDGSRFWASVVTTALHDDAGKLVGFGRITRDLSERLQAEERMQREHRHRLDIERDREGMVTTLRSIGDAVIAADEEGKIKMMNPVAEALTGWRESEATGVPLETVFRIVSSDTRREAESPVSRAMQSGTFVGLANHTTLIARDGTETPIDDSAAPIRDGDGQTLGVVLVFRNATAEKVAALRRAFLGDLAEAISASRDPRAVLERMAALAVPRLADWIVVHLVEPERAPVQVAVAHFDPDKVALAKALATKVRTSGERSRGIEHVARTGVAELYADVPEDLVAEAAQTPEMLRVARALAPRSLLIVPIKSGARTLGAISLVYAESNRRFGPEDVEFGEDVGRRVGAVLENARLFDEARRSREMADDANRMKDQFLATASHELRTPLNAILGWAKLLDTPAIDEPKRARGLETIVRNATAMTRLIEDLLDVSRIVSGKLRLDMTPIEVVPIVESAIESVRPAAEQKGVQLLALIPTRGSKVVGDAARIQQIVSNLLTNAVKFTASGGEVQVALRADAGGLELAVTDSGIGIDPTFVPHLFEPFRQADATLGRTRTGLGLGLAITKRLVEAHRGSIEARSDGLGRGASFVVRLPVAGTSHAPATSECARDDGAALRDRRVLVVDDDPDARAVATAALERCGAIVRTAESAEEALAAIAREVPDVLISDIGMPGETGYELIQKVRALGEDRGARMPAVALTAYARGEDRRAALDAGFTAHVPKPLDPSELCAVVSALGRSSGRGNDSR